MQEHALAGKCKWVCCKATALDKLQPKMQSMTTDSCQAMARKIKFTALSKQLQLLAPTMVFSPTVRFRESNSRRLASSTLMAFCAGQHHITMHSHQSFHCH